MSSDEGLDKGREIFIEEAQELLTELESALLELEENPADTELVGRVFRAMHTIKGSGAMFGYDDIAKFTHEVETTFDMVRNGEIPVTTNLINLTLMARDQIRTMIEASQGGPQVDEARSKEIISGFKLVMAKDSAEREVASSVTATDTSTTGQKEAPIGRTSIVTYRVRFRPAPELFATGTNPILLLNELREVGKATIIAQTEAIPALEDFDPETCLTYWDIVLTTDKGIDAIKDVFIFVEDLCEVKIETIDEGGVFDEDERHLKLGEILLSRGDVRLDDLKGVLGKQKRVGEILVELGITDESHVASALAEQKHIKEVKEQKQKTDTASIRVPSEKLDKLVDLVGELVTVQARLSQTVTDFSDGVLMSISEEVERLTWELRDNTMSIRMLPIGSTFSKFKRLLRDLSADLGKEVNLTTDGAETELDKTVIEKLNDPLVHIIRNSVDHGIEQPDVRVAAGKSRYGTVHLTAGHSGANVLIQIQDDGKGLDKDVLFAKAVEKGIIQPDAELSEKEIFSLIFAPGFSTAQKLTSVSGRGVGMDVVKRNIEALRGTVDIKSKLGVGTTITLKLPLTLAIIDGLLVKVADDFFVIPLSVVQECVELTKEDIARMHNRHISNVRGAIVPYIVVREHFLVDGPRPDVEQIVVTEVEDKRVGFVVDYVIGEHQTVIKTLGRIYRDVEGISGATILGDGTVALIMDIPKLVSVVEKIESSSYETALSA
ncbi:MAG: chemotaxis protein CheA [Nitrospirae bacterium]|nr:chemotaxis protein CheA [Nitrospirota bacterium]